MRKHMALLPRTQRSFSILYTTPQPQASSFFRYTWAAHKYLPWSSASAHRAGLMAVCAAHPGSDKESPSGAPTRDWGTEAAHRAWSRQSGEGHP